MMNKNDQNILKEKKSFVAGSLLVILLINVGLIMAQFAGGTSGFGGDYQVIGSSSNPQFNQPQFNLGSGFDITSLWKNFNKEDCTERQDMLLMIPPGGCSPQVVRSDLLEEQNVPIFCKVSSIELNPLIDISKIKSIMFRAEDKPKEVQSVSYFPARAAIRSGKKLEASPVADNVGYLVIVLKGGMGERDMPDFVEGNVSAVIDYTSEGVFGVGQQDFFLREISDEDWFRNYRSSGFWNGKGYLRASEIEENSAVISVYTNPGARTTSVKLEKGRTSDSINLGGYYCSAGMKLKLEDVDFPQDSALIRVDDEEFWVGKGSKFLDGKCSVASVRPGELGAGNVRIRCSGAGSFDLRINPIDISFRVKGDFEDFSVGDFVTSQENKAVYLAYAGLYPGARSKYSVLIASESAGIDRFDGIGNFINSKERVWFNGGFFGNLFRLGLFDSIGGDSRADLAHGYRYSEKEEEYYTYLLDELEDRYPFLEEENIKILIGSGARWEKYDIVSEDRDIGSALLESDLLEEYYNDAIDSYNDLAALYPNERSLGNLGTDVYAAMGLRNAGRLAEALGLEIDQREFYERIIENYGDSSFGGDIQTRLNTLSSGTSRESQALVYVNDEPHFISLFKIKSPGPDEAGAELLFAVDGKQKVELWSKDSLETVPGLASSDKKIPIEITDIGEDSVEIRYAPDFSSADAVMNTLSRAIIGKTARWQKETLPLNQLVPLTQEVSVKLTKINLHKEARVKIIPEVRGTRTEADFGFKIGIEKRSIELSPERTEKLIGNLQKEIKKWTEVNEKLGKVVKGLKGACFATSALLTIKNFFGGLTGAAGARNEVMTSTWNKRCGEWSGPGATADPVGKTYRTVDECLLAHNSEIEQDVEALTKQIEARNQELSEIQQSGEVRKTSDWIFAESVNNADVTREYRENVFSKTNWAGVSYPGQTNRTVADVVGNGSSLTLTEMRDLVTYTQLEGSSTLRESANTRVDRILEKADNRLSYQRAEARAEGDFPGIASGPSLETKKKYTTAMTSVSGFGGATHAFRYNVPSEDVIDESIRGKTIKIGVKLSAGRYVIVRAEDNQGTEVTSEAQNHFSKYEIIKADSTLYRNKIQGDLRILYYERAPYKGLPQIVPFDRDEGWYAATDYVITGQGRPYEDSGRAVNFWICNVGENGRLEFKQGDECRYYNVGSPARLDFPGLSESESRKLVTEAQKALRDASAQYGKEDVVINGQRFKSGIAGDGTSGRCSDFMSPAECNLLFNLCDPVICPSSRCDFGGSYRVDNVIQSGIIGSLALCLPNFPEVKIPVCLSGVHAGIDAYLSILNSTEACLQESLETGKNVGICDEIKSVYLCEFFWKQIAPLLDVAIPRIFEFALGQGVRGGGEYTTVQDAWDNTQKSINSFKNDYAVNAFEAFNIRSTSEAGGEVCRAFVGGRYPDSADFFDKLTEPDSPIQYSGWFDENVLNTATIPPTSHYKVYYHIYAGKDTGAQYVVSLRGSEDTGLVQRTGDYVVDRGYINRGGQVDEAKDFSAASGFTQLCISVNGKEDCNFKQTSTSAAINYMQDKYVADQLSDEIKTASECVAGKSSLLGLAQPNIQGGVEQAISPELYKRGIVRVCSTNNPGAQVDETTGELDPTRSIRDRWKDVGYCDDESIRCWVDTETVKDVLDQNKVLQDKALEDIDSSYFGDIPILTPAEAEEKLAEARKILGLIGTRKDIPTKQLTRAGIQGAYGKILGQLNNVTEKGPNNNFRANAFFLQGEIHGRLALRIYLEHVLGEKAVVTTPEGEVLEIVPTRDLREGYIIEKRFEPSGHCRYVFQNNNWLVTVYGRRWDEKRGGGYQLDITYDDCLDLSGVGYLAGIGQIAEAYGGTDILIAESAGAGRERISSANAQELETKLIQILEERKTSDIEVVTMDVTVNLDGDKTVCEYREYKVWICTGDAKADLETKLRNKDYAEGVRVLVEVADFTDDVIINGQKVENKLFVSDESITQEVLNIVKLENLRGLYTGRDTATSHFSSFTLKGDTYWEDDGSLFLDDRDVAGNSGYVFIKMKDDWTGKLTLELSSQDTNWFESYTKIDPDGTNSPEIVLSGGDSLVIDVDKDFGGRSFMLRGEESGKDSVSDEKIDDEVTIKLVSITD